jgi:hypothetical protein
MVLILITHSFERRKKKRKMEGETGERDGRWMDGWMGMGRGQVWKGR